MYDDRQWMFRLAEPDTVRDWRIPPPIARLLIGEQVEMLIPGNTQEIDTRLRRLVGRPLGTGTIVGRAENGEFWFAVRHNGPDGEVVLPRVVEGRVTDQSPGLAAVDIREAQSWTGLTFFGFGALVIVIVGLFFALDLVGVKTLAFGHGLASPVLGSVACVVMLALGWELADLVRARTSGLREIVIAELGSQAEPGIVPDSRRTAIDWRQPGAR